jgi:pilus assembly protein CpaF
MSKSPEHFTSEQEAVDIIKKMTRQGRHVIDMGKPMADSYYTRGTRISALVSPVLDDDVGVACSIRKQTKQNVTREKYLQWGTATERELDFITDCTNYGIPIIFAGATGTGKTTDIQFAASTIPLGKRIFVIEETRELNLVRYDLEGNIISSVIHTKTRQSDNKDMVITENDLLKEALRFTPKYIIPAEMRGMEAYTALKAAQTGHTVITSIHAESAKNAYYRVLCLCRENPEAQTFTDAMLYRMIAEAFPLVVFKHQLADGSRKIIEIVEAAGFEKEEIIFKTLFSYEIVENVYDKNDVLKEIKGRHVLGSPVSSRIIEKMRFGGASNKVLARYIKEVENQ